MCVNLSNQKKNGLFRGFVGDEMLPSSAGMRINHDTDPYLTNQYNGMSQRVLNVGFK